uniref:Integrase zinc-binding domain-containing protein n=1 Tax=Daphnia galeata TaxID=27404 RepID=A0A8J2RPI0_9CRUS|nr:unnamed protein product [Daphnia galeata]
MAVAVRDAVSSVSQEHIVMFTSVVTSLCAKLPIHLQSDWGKLAYGLNRFPTLQDFDKWIDTVVGAEELRGIKLSTSNPVSSGLKPTQSQYNTSRPANTTSQSAGSSNYGGRGPTILTQSLLTNTEIECPACKEKGKHRLENCNVFARMLVNARAALCATTNHCFRYLIRGHYSSKCRRQSASCTECNGPHHTLLHGAERQFPVPQTEQGNNPIILLVRAPQPSIRPVLLAIVNVVIEANGFSCTSFAVLDPGSEATLITRSLANILQLRGTSALDLPAIDSEKVEILIGMDLSTAHQTTQIIEPIEGEKGPTAHCTRFGWAVAGRIPQSLVVGPSNRKNINLQSTWLPPSLTSIVNQFRSLETFGIVPKPKSRKSQDEEDLLMVSMLQSSIVFVGCGFQIALPLRNNIPVIPNNRSQALSRFYAIEQRLMQPNMRDIAGRYQKAIDKLITSGTAVQVKSSDVSEPAGKIWYLPLFYVINCNKPTKLESFLTLLHDSKAYYRYALSADIEAFYHRVGVAKQDQSLQRFVFRPFGSNGPVRTFQFTTLIFGAVCSSSAAVQTLHHAAKTNVTFPQVAAKMQDNFYSDNLFDSFETESEAAGFAKAVTKTLEAGGFHLTAFASTSQQILETIPPQHRSPQVLDINLNALPVEYQLGMKWDLATDTYGIRVRSMPEVYTKRELLSAMSLVFDPLGMCIPVITAAKLLLQETQKLNKASPCCWDAPLPVEILAKWRNWATGLSNTSFPCVSRCFRPLNFPLDSSIFRLVIFADASSVAFGAVAYLRIQCDDQINLSFVMAKGRIASLKPTTVPRLELEAAIVLHQLRSEKPNRPPFVCKRREEILAHSALKDWHFVRSEDNPADDCTRASPPKDFGPEPFIFHTDKLEDDDVASTVNVGQLHVTPSCCHPLAPAISGLIARATQLTELKREVAQLSRAGLPANESLSTNDLQEAFRICLMDDGLLKVDGRLEHAQLPARTRHPIIIAADHPLTKLIINDHHVKIHHAGVEHTLSVVREQFYLLQGRRAIRRTLAKCESCGRVKRYGLLITCLSSRAVHIESLDSMDADSFIMALRRFISIRGCPKVIYSDNGTNLLAGEKELLRKGSQI